MCKYIKVLQFPSYFVILKFETKLYQIKDIVWFQISLNKLT